MIQYRSFIYESLQISLAKKAFEKLSRTAKDAILQWQRDNWIGGQLEQHILRNDDVAKELRDAMKPILDSIKGDEIELFRGTRTSNLNQPRLLESWTSSEQVARYFAGLSMSQISEIKPHRKIHSVDEIEDAVNEFKRKGFLKFNGYYYLMNKNDHNSYWIFNSERQLIVDGNDLKYDLITNNEDSIKIKNSLNDSIVLRKKFNKSNIIWITNDLNSKEYIMRVN